MESSILTIPKPNWSSFLKALDDMLQACKDAQNYIHPFVHSHMVPSEGTMPSAYADRFAKMLEKAYPNATLDTPANIDKFLNTIPKELRDCIRIQQEADVLQLLLRDPTKAKTLGDHPHAWAQIQLFVDAAILNAQRSHTKLTFPPLTYQEGELYTIVGLYEAGTARSARLVREKQSLNSTMPPIPVVSSSVSNRRDRNNCNRTGNLPTALTATS